MTAVSFVACALYGFPSVFVPRSACVPFFAANFAIAHCLQKIVSFASLVSHARRFYATAFVTFLAEKSQKCAKSYCVRLDTSKRPALGRSSGRLASVAFWLKKPKSNYSQTPRPRKVFWPFFATSLFWLKKPKRSVAKKKPEASAGTRALSAMRPSLRPWLARPVGVRGVCGVTPLALPRGGVFFVYGLKIARSQKKSPLSYIPDKIDHERIFGFVRFLKKKANVRRINLHC